MGALRHTENEKKEKKKKNPEIIFRFLQNINVSGQTALYSYKHKLVEL